jgi:hydroxycarboxylate dehydrogenase A
MMQKQNINGYVLSPKTTMTGPGCWHAARRSIGKLGRRAFVLGGGRALIAADAVVQALKDDMACVQVQIFHGECTEGAIAAAARIATDYDVVIGIGGGKVIDTAKAAALGKEIPCVTVPTSPATCAAYTPLSIIHDERGAYVESRRLAQPVDLMILDPELMVNSPARLLSAGCVDALARSMDTQLAARVGVPTLMAAFSASVCDHVWRDVLRPQAIDAMAARRERRVRPAYTSVVEACIIGAGLAGQLGARFFGRSFSHAVGYALADVVDNSAVLHGEAVGLGILVQCALDPETAISLDAMLAYFEALGAPTRFADIGVEGLAGDYGRRLSSKMFDLLDRDHGVPFAVSVDDIHRGLLAVEQAGEGQGRGVR